MSEAVGIDTAAVSALADRLAQAAAALSGAEIAHVDGLPGSAVAGLNGPARAADDVRRLAAAAAGWAAAAHRSAGDVIDADQDHAGRIGPR